MIIINWISDNYIEIFGAAAGILYVFLEIRQSIWLWPVGIVTSAVYVWVFLTGKLYADMSLQVYYLAISVIGWFWWSNGSGHRARGAGQSQEEKKEKGRRGENVTELIVTRIGKRISVILAVFTVILFGIMWIILSTFTDSPVPGWDSFITSLSIVATWMLARKFFEHWYLWILINAVAAGLFLSRGLYPTVVLYVVYCIMSFAGAREWKKSILKKE